MAPLRGRGVVLLVDDDLGVRSVAGRILREAGYVVIEAADGLQAWTLFLREPESFHVVVADVVMPRMPGTELAARIQARRPELPVLLMSAYTDADLTARGLLAAPGTLVTKPFDAATLVASVERALGRQGRSGSQPTDRPAP